jgi:hypothetical protein
MFSDSSADKPPQRCVKLWQFKLAHYLPFAVGFASCKSHLANGRGPGPDAVQTSIAPALAGVGLSTSKLKLCSASLRQQMRIRQTQPGVCSCGGLSVEQPSGNRLPRGPFLQAVDDASHMLLSFIGGSSKPCFRPQSIFDFSQCNSR